MLNSGSSSEWGDDQLPDDDQLIGTQSWTETSPDQLVVIYRSNFHQTGFTEVKINDADDRPHLVRLENLSQLTRSGERIERGDPLRRMHVKISLARECNRSTEEVIRLMNELASIQREFPYPNPRDRVPMHEYYGEPASDDFKVDSPLREQNMQSFRDARRYIFTDSVLNMKSVAHLFPKDTRIFFMPRATLLQMGTALEVLQANELLAEYQQVLFIFGPDQFREYHRGARPDSVISQDVQREFIYRISEFIHSVKQKRQKNEWSQLVVCLPPGLPDYDPSQQEVFHYAAEYMNAHGIETIITARDVPLQRIPANPSGLSPVFTWEALTQIGEAWCACTETIPIDMTICDALGTNLYQLCNLMPQDDEWMKKFLRGMGLVALNTARLETTAESEHSIWELDIVKQVMDNAYTNVYVKQTALFTHHLTEGLKPAQGEYPQNQLKPELHQINQNLCETVRSFVEGEDDPSEFADLAQLLQQVHMYIFREVRCLRRNLRGTV